MVMVMKHVYSWLAVSIITHTYILHVCVEPEAVWYRVSELYEVGMHLYDTGIHISSMSLHGGFYYVREYTITTLLNRSPDSPATAAYIYMLSVCMYVCMYTVAR